MLRLRTTIVRDAGPRWPVRFPALHAHSHFGPFTQRTRLTRTMSLTPVSTNPDAPTMGSTLSAPDMAPGGTTSLKRRATSAALSDVDEVSRKKVKMAHNSALEALPENDAVVPIDGVALADDLGQELECGCCAAVIYRPVVIIPCQHFFCGRYVQTVLHHHSY
jgi:hypothetical protein